MVVVIEDDDTLLRRIHPKQVVDDKNRGGKRPSSAAFKDPELSVDSEPLLVLAGKDWNYCLVGYPTHSLVSFAAGVAREKGLEVAHKPTIENSAHAEVLGKKTGSIASALSNASAWRYLAPEEPAPV